MILMSNVILFSDDPRYPLMGCEAPVLYLPPPPEQPPPSDIGSPPDSPTPRPRRMPRGMNTKHPSMNIHCMLC